MVQRSHSSADLDLTVSADSGRQGYARTAVVVALTIILVGGVAGARYYFKLQDTPSPPPLHSQPRRVMAKAVLIAGPPTNANSVPASAPAKMETSVPVVEITAHPMDQFRDDLKKRLVQQVTAMYPQMPDINRDPANSVEDDYRDSVFRFLDAAENAPAEQQLPMLLAADFMLQALWCPDEQKEKCEQLRQLSSAHDVTFAHVQLGGGFYYQHDLLWRLWKESPTSEWGQSAFVLLADSGWDTSSACAKGTDQFREVVRQGEVFLQQYPESPVRVFVEHLVGNAYATWWSLSNQPTGELEEYVDTKQYQEGSEEARAKAIEHFEKVLQLSSGTMIGEHARQMLAALRERQLTSESYRYFCIYD